MNVEIVKRCNAITQVNNMHTVAKYARNTGKTILFFFYSFNLKPILHMYASYQLGLSRADKKALGQCDR